jgi:drug/metabolite transporter (DMT)-like permease
MIAALGPALTAALLMVAAAAVTSVQGLLIRVAADSGIHAFEIAFFRSFFGFVAMAVVVLATTRRVPRVTALRPLGGSSLFHLMAMLSFFYGMAMMPLAESAALTFTAPLFGTLAAALFLGERVHARRWIAILVGFLGVLVVLRPGMVPVGIGPALVLFSTVAFAGVTVLVKRMTATEATTSVVFYQSLFVSVLTLPAALPVWTTPDPTMLAWLALIGALSTVGWLCFTRAFALADASALLPLEFTRLPFVALLGYLAFGEVPDVWVWLGAAVIFASGLAIAHRENAAARVPGK